MPSIGALVTTAQVATSLKQAWNNETLTDTTATCTPVNVDGGTGATGGARYVVQFDEVTAGIVGSIVTLTGRTAGKEVTLTRSVTSAGGTVTEGALTAANGRNWWSNQDNWSGNAVPINGDDIVLDSGEQDQHDITAGLVTGIQPASFKKFKSFKARVGRAEINKDDTSRQYAEDRAKRLTFNNNAVTCTYDLEIGEGQGSSLFRLDTTDGRSIFNVYRAGQRVDNSLPPMLLAGVHTSNELNNFNGDVGCAFYQDESLVLAKLKHGTGEASEAKTWCGANCNLVNVTAEINDGEIRTFSPIATTSGSLTIYAGKHCHYAGNVKNMTIVGGEFLLRAGADLTLEGTIKIYDGGKLDLSEYQHELTISVAIQLHKGAKLWDPNNSLKVGTQVQFIGCTSDDVEFISGRNRTLTIAA